MRRRAKVSKFVITVSFFCISFLIADPAPEGFESLFNGTDFSGWKVPEGDGGHWRIVDGVIDYDARSKAEGGNDGRSLWTRKSYRDFELRIDWRIKPDGGLRHRVPYILPSGDYKTDDQGAVEEIEIEDVDSGIYLRGTAKGQVNIWMWPVGSGEVWAFRKNSELLPEVRAACTPNVRADKPRGEWNQMTIILKEEQLSVVLNSKKVIDKANLEGLPREGPIALQHHGTWDPENKTWVSKYGPGRWSGAPSLVQFRNIFIRELYKEFHRR